MENANWSDPRHAKRELNQLRPHFYCSAQNADRHADLRVCRWISALPKKLQLELLAQFQILPEDLDHLDSERFGVIQREGKKLYRYRAKDYRIYFAKTDEGIKVHRVLHKNTFRDFLFRTKLPVSEDAQLREKPEFWELIEQGERTRKG